MVSRGRYGLLIACSTFAMLCAAEACFVEVPAVSAPDGSRLEPEDVTNEPVIDGGAEDAPPEAMANGCPLDMVRGPGVCIDSVEVSARKYYEFVRAAVAANLQPTHPRCGWSSSWAPDTGGGLIEDDDRPVANVTWCQAFEYCHAKGKRLCGRVGNGGTIEIDQVGKPEFDEWYQACSGGEGKAYCYSNTFSATACNTSTDAGVDNREPVGTRPTCSGGVAGLFDMSGNVFEWLDACKIVDGGDGYGDECAYHGGGYLDYAPPATLSRCVALDRVGRHSAARSIGFRCCGTPTE